MSTATISEPIDAETPVEEISEDLTGWYYEVEPSYGWSGPGVWVHEDCPVDFDEPFAGIGDDTPTPAGDTLLTCLGFGEQRFVPSRY